ncbi:MAG: carboxypeptidase regulatory-like domain-containing protein [Planctomycetes bacterium]|nr:carboxypeptidase regulatory-like domain-containing protein [Planctomycetota bacterium]
MDFFQQNGWLLLWSALALSGCRGPAVPARVPVEGKLLLNGQPLANKSLRFVPESGDGLTGQGTTDAQGNFNLMTVVPGALRDYFGLPPGAYKVVVQDSMSIMSTAGDGGAGEMLIPGAGSTEIPSFLQSEDTTRLRVEVRDGKRLELDLAKVE